MEHCVITLQDLLDSANQKRLPTHQEMIQKSLFDDIKWGASSRWLFRPNSAWGSIATKSIGKMHTTLYQTIFIGGINSKKESRDRFSEGGSHF